MSSTTLVPFGLDEQTGEFVDVHAVPRGAACGCICPSCRTPLVAKRSEGDRVWHFAHESRGTDEKIKAECQYSLYVALKLMSRQLFRTATHVRLPKLAVSRAMSGYPVIRVVREEADVAIIGVDIESRLGGIAVDVVATIHTERGGAQIGFHFSHPGRLFLGVPEEARQEMASSKAGIVDVDLEDVWDSVIVAAANRQYRDALMTTLTKTAVGKAWRFHPAEARALKDLEREVLQREQEARRSTARSPARSEHDEAKSVRLQHAIDGALVEFGCRPCSIRFTVIQLSPAITCPRCRGDAEKIGPGSRQAFASQHYMKWESL